MWKIKQSVIDLPAMAPAIFAAGMFLLALTQGCSTLHVITVPAEKGESPATPHRVVLPYDFPAGFTAKGRELAIVRSPFDFWDRPVSAHELPRPGDDLEKFTDELIRVADPRGLRVCGFSGSIEHLESVIAGGCPVIAFISPPTAKRRIVLVYGFDPESRTLFVHQGGHQRVEFAYAEFLAVWQPQRAFMITIVPPDLADWEPAIPEVFSTAEFRARKNEWDLAAKAYEEGEAIAPENLELLYGRASVWDRAEKWREAEQVYKEILARDSLQSRAANNLSHVLGEMGIDAAGSLQWAKRAVVLDPGNPVYLATLSAAQEQAGLTSDAVSSMEKAHHRASSLSPDSQRAIIEGLVRLYRSTGQDHLARQVLDDYRQRDHLFKMPASP